MADHGKRGFEHGLIPSRLHFSGVVTIDPAATDGPRAKGAETGSCPAALWKERGLWIGPAFTRVTAIAASCRRPREVVPYLVPLRRRATVAITASEARKNLFPLIEKVNADRTPVEITSKAGRAVLMSADDWEAWQETAYLFQSPANARRLLDAADALDQGRGIKAELAE